MKSEDGALRGSYGETAKGRGHVQRSGGGEPEPAGKHDFVEAAATDCPGHKPDGVAPALAIGRLRIDCEGYAGDARICGRSRQI
jgi:hypothetical protein